MKYHNSIFIRLIPLCTFLFYCVSAAGENEPSATLSKHAKVKAAPNVNTDRGWHAELVGRALYDYNDLSSVPLSINILDEGATHEVRRLRLGVQGTAPNGFGYKIIGDYADDATIIDAYVNYKNGLLKITLGQQNTFQGLEELSSSNDTSFTERSAFTDAFGFERRVGISASVKVDHILLEGGVFSDNIDDLGGQNNSFSVDGRVSYANVFRDALIHLGGSIHMRDLGNEIDTVQYRQRPFAHSVNTRFIDTGEISNATDEVSYGLEVATIAGRFHLAAEMHWLEVNRSAFADPRFFGGSIEAGYFLTQDQRGYKSGSFEGVKVNNPVSHGGAGAWQVNLRYDTLDLVDAGIVGGSQNAYMVSLIWTPVDKARLILNYSQLYYSNALGIVDGAPNDFSVNVLGARAQVSF
jgi:phosphate-selective porin OprO/OprP